MHPFRNSMTKNVLQLHCHFYSILRIFFKLITFIAQNTFYRKIRKTLSRINFVRKLTLQIVHIFEHTFQLQRF